MTRTQKTLLLGIFHLVCLSVYMIPILHHTLFSDQQYKHEMNRVAVLDESHIMSESNKDINGADVPLETIFSNDYWGRPMNSPSSHKSWRPLTVLSFRWLTSSNNLPAAYQLLIHRLFNIITHAVIAELVGVLAVELVKGFLPLASQQQATTAYLTLLYLLTKAFFVLHPTHVEVTANAANRPHLLGALCAVLLSNPNLPWGLFLSLLVAGYLSSETFLFTLPPIVITLALIVLSQHLYKQQQHILQRRNQVAALKKKDDDALAATNKDIDDHDDNEQDDEKEESSVLVAVFAAVLPRVFLLILSAFAYFGGRFLMDWLSIPEGLIRPAENPFYRLEGWTRFRSYIFVLAIHIAKSWSLDFIGFSHEYGHACILPITSWTDGRFLATIVAGVVLGIGVLVTLLLTYKTRPLVAVIILLQLSWMVTLFPISGIVKVGTFIADRIVVASTVSTCIVLGVAFTSMIVPLREQKISKPRYNKAVALLVLVLLGYQWSVIHRRTLEWMGWIPLLTSALKTCPRFAKAHLEFSKITNGLYQEEFNLTKSRWHVTQAETFDPNFCDVHQQYAQIAVQENKHIEFEERLSKAVTCTFTSSGSADLWQRYWKMTLDAQQNTNPQGLQAAQNRYKEYMKEIQKAIDREAEKAAEEERMQLQKKKSPFFWDHLRS
jgi:hypothetical protein